MRICFRWCSPPRTPFVTPTAARASFPSLPHTYNAVLLSAAASSVLSFCLSQQLHTNTIRCGEQNTVAAAISTFCCNTAVVDFFNLWVVFLFCRTTCVFCFFFFTLLIGFWIWILLFCVSSRAWLSVHDFCAGAPVPPPPPPFLCRKLFLDNLFFAKHFFWNLFMPLHFLGLHFFAECNKKKIDCCYVFWEG